ncbi:O-antigen ligase family protein, partial [Clostridium neonatale]
MAPLTFAFLYVYKETLKIRYLILSISGLGICILSNSSSFYLALLIYIVIYMFFIKNSNSFTKKKLFIYILLIISFVCLIVLYKDIVLIGIQALTEKLQGQNSSGIARGTAFKTHINVFKENVMFGIGFGTTRSYDLFSSWLVQVG